MFEANCKLSIRVAAQMNIMLRSMCEHRGFLNLLRQLVEIKTSISVFLYWVGRRIVVNWWLVRGCVASGSRRDHLAKCQLSSANIFILGLDWMCCYHDENCETRQKVFFFLGIWRGRGPYSRHGKKLSMFIYLLLTDTYLIQTWSNGNLQYCTSYGCPAHLHMLVDLQCDTADKKGWSSMFFLNCE